MASFVIRRILRGVASLLVVAFLVFFLMRTLPGGPFDFDKPLPPEVVQSLEKYYGLHDPLWKQFVTYIGNALQGDLGRSYTARDMPVTELIGNRWPISAELGLYASLIALFLGVPLGVLAAYHHNRWIDYVASFLAIVGRSIPPIALAPILILIFSLTLRWFPVARWTTWDARILPSIALGLASAATIARLTRASMLQIIREDFVRTARAKGLSELTVMFKHALRNALLPIISVFGITIAVLLTGTFVVEMIFAIPGLGLYFVTSIGNRDYPVVMGTSLLFAFAIIFMNVLVDILYGIVDPRVRLS